MTTSTEEQHATAILTALNAALTPKRAYDVDEIPPTRPNEYVELTIARRFGGERRLSARIGSQGYRVLARVVSRTSVSNARVMAEQCRAALEFTRLTVAGDTTTPIQFESEDPIGPDEGWFSGLATFTYVI